MTLGIFDVDGCEWWLGETAQQVADAYLAQTTLAAGEAFDGTLPQLLTDEQLDTHTFTDHDGTRRSFRELLELERLRVASVPRLFASAEF